MKGGLYRFKSSHHPVVFQHSKNQHCIPVCWYTLNTSKERCYLEAKGTVGTITLEWRREIGWNSVEWIHLAQDRNQWQAVVNMVMNTGFHIRWGI
jgi:hypothetical protein